jgi:hypothetical protein
MQSTSNYRLPAAVLEADREALLALEDLVDYAPNNTAHSTATLLALKQVMDQADAAEIRSQKALIGARDAAIAASWEFHNAILGVKSQVSAQYGNDSAAVQALGLKRKSDRRRAPRRASTPSAK